MDCRYRIDANAADSSCAGEKQEPGFGLQGFGLARSHLWPVTTRGMKQDG